MNSIASSSRSNELFDIRIEPDVLDVNVFSLYPCLTCYIAHIFYRDQVFLVILNAAEI